jgi:hypothetical protein
MLRVISFLILLFCLINQFYLVAVGLFIWYLFKYSGYELVILGMLLDGYYGAFYAIPFLTLGTFLTWILVGAAKQRLLLYTEKNEVISQKTP